MNFLKNFLKGMAVGIATLVPGVSGGTMAIIFGIYDNIIHSIGSFFENWKKHTVFLMQVGLGAVLGMAAFSKLMVNVLDRYPEVMQFLFIGIIIGGLPVLYKKSAVVSKRKASDYIFLLAGFVVVLLMSSDPEAAKSVASPSGFKDMMTLFAGGIVLAVALVLPGISGSFMLLALGLYGVTLNAIDTRNIPFLIPLGLGVAVGTLGTTKIIEKFLMKHPSKAYMLIMGFVLGSLIPVFPGIPSGMSLIASIIGLIAGFLVIFWLGLRGITD